MKLDTLASLIIDVSESFNPDDLISLSAMGDRQIISQYYCDPRSGTPLLQDYDDSQLEKLLSGCKDLSDVTAKVEKLYREQPLDADESRYVRSLGLHAVMDATYKIANNRGLGGCRNAHESIVALVVQELRDHLNTFQK